MARYLFADNYLADIDDVASARINIGLGNTSTMNSNDIDITGGNITIDSFALKSKTPLTSDHFFLKNSDSVGSIEWFEIPSLDWLVADQGQILLSEFSNDAKYIRCNELASVALSGNYYDINNLPRLKDVYQNDVLYTFLDRRSNLSDLSDIKQARINLGLGDLATQSTDNVTISNLTINNSLEILNGFTTAGYLYIDATSNITSIDLPKATNTIRGTVNTCNVNIDDSNVVPTSSVLYELYSNINSNMDVLKLNELDEITNLFNGNFLARSNFLSEYATLSEKLQVRTNLGLGDLATQNSNNVSVSNLNINTLTFSSPGNAGLLYFNSVGTGILSNLPTATETTPGVVYTLNDYYSYVPNRITNITVLTHKAFNDYSNEIQSQVVNLKNSIPTNIEDLDGSSVYLFRSNNLSDLTNKSDARSNLQLKKVAHTGQYRDLEDKPYNISTFNNNVGFMHADSNLEELTDKYQARINLGLGTMATQDSNNISIKGGIVEVEDMYIRNKFLYQSSVNPQGKILTCVSRNGRMEWRDLPRASYSSYGAVKIAPYILENDTRTDVVPSCEVFSQMEANIISQIDKALRKYDGVLKSLYGL